MLKRNKEINNRTDYIKLISYIIILILKKENKEKTLKNNYINYFYRIIILVIYIIFSKSLIPISVCVILLYYIRCLFTKSLELKPINHLLYKSLKVNYIF